MAQSAQKRRISVTIDSELLETVDQLTDNRSSAFEEALRLWHAQKCQAKLRNFYQQQAQLDVNDAAEWVRETQDGAIAHWENEAP